MPLSFGHAGLSAQWPARKLDKQFTECALRSTQQQMVHEKIVSLYNGQICIVKEQVEAEHCCLRLATLAEMCGVMVRGCCNIILLLEKVM